jgi:phosphohistidine phosphatase
MRVLLVRHGPAVDPYAAPTDELRWLTDAGRARVLHVGTKLRELGLRFDQIFTSPLVRSVQTAELLVRAHPDYLAPIETVRGLSAETGTTAQALAPLDTVDQDDLVALVTHEPKIRVLAGHLTGHRDFPAFKPGGACLIERSEGQGRLLWRLDPKTLELETGV